MKGPSKEIALAASSLALWGAVWWSTTDLPPKAATYPRFILVGLIAFSVLHLGQAIRDSRGHAARGRKDTETSDRSDRKREGSSIRAPSPARAMLLALSALLYVFAIPSVGYILATAMFGLPWLGSAWGWNWKPLLGSAIVFSVLYVVLTMGLDVRIPGGRLV